MQAAHPGSEHCRRNWSLKASKFQSLLLCCNHLIVEQTDTLHCGTLMNVQGVGGEQWLALWTEASTSFSKDALVCRWQSTETSELHSSNPQLANHPLIAQCEVWWSSCDSGNALRYHSYHWSLERMWIPTPKRSKDDCCQI